jgi:hypothetical protein
MFAMMISKPIFGFSIFVPTIGVGMRISVNYRSVLIKLSRIDRKSLFQAVYEADGILFKTVL